MTVKIGSARIDENGKAHGGKAGDQTGRELSTQNWYRHKKGWRVLRARNSGVAERIARACEAACANPRIGYDQYQRHTLRVQAAALQPAYFPGAVTKDCETDCSELVRTCVAYAAGRDIVAEVLGSSRFSTLNMVYFLTKTGLFTELKGTRYTDACALLRRGDILVTRTQGHTAIVLSNGDGADTARLQQALLDAGYTLPRYGANGAYNAETEFAANLARSINGLSEDEDLIAFLRNMTAAETPVYTARVTGRRVNVREKPTTVRSAVVRVTGRGDCLPAYGMTANGWHRLKDGWISGAYTLAVPADGE